MRCSRRRLAPSSATPGLSMRSRPSTSPRDRRATVDTSRTSATRASRSGCIARSFRRRASTRGTTHLPSAPAPVLHVAHGLRRGLPERVYPVENAAALGALALHARVMDDTCLRVWRAASRGSARTPSQVDSVSVAGGRRCRPMPRRPIPRAAWGVVSRRTPSRTPPRDVGLALLRVLLELSTIDGFGVVLEHPASCDNGRRRRDRRGPVVSVCCRRPAFDWRERSSPGRRISSALTRAFAVTNATRRPSCRSGIRSASWRSPSSRSRTLSFSLVSNADAARSSKAHAAPQPEDGIGGRGSGGRREERLAVGGAPPGPPARARVPGVVAEPPACLSCWKPTELPVLARGRAEQGRRGRRAGSRSGEASSIEGRAT